jgi:PhnB protein
MHSQLKTDAGFTLMASDTPASMEYTPGSAISVSLSGDDDAELRGYWDGLAEGGRIALPLEMAPWGDSFGMVQDRFGVNWMVNILGPQKQEEVSG